MADSSTYTPDTLNRRAMYAQELLKQGSDTSPIKSWTQGAARLAQALVGGMALRKDTDQQGEASKSLAALLMGGQQGGAQTPASPATTPVASAGAPDYGKAISSIESGGKYDATGPATKTGDQAYGKYQVMGANIPEWTKHALGYSMTPADYLSNPQAQDATFNDRFNGYVKKYGPEGAAKAWFAGEGGMNNPNAKDQLGTSVAQYGQRFTQALGGQQSQQPAPNQVASLDPTAGVAQAAPQAATPPPQPQMQPAQQPQMAQAQPSMPQSAPQMQQPDMRSVVTKMLQSDNPYVQRQGQALASTLITKQMAPPEWKQIGQTIMGQPLYGWVNQNNQSVTAANPQSAGGQGMMPAGIDENKPMYDQLPKPQQQVVDSMLAGRMPMPSSMALKTPYWNTLISAANERAVANGTHFDATDWKQRFDTASDFSTKGKTGQSMNALDTVQGHLEKLSNDVEKLDNGGWSYWNSMRNGIANTTPLDPTRTKAVQAVNDDTKAVTDEMARAYKTGAMSDKEISEWQKLISSADSKEKQRQALTDFVHLLNTKRQTNYSQYEKVMGKPYVSQNEGANARIQKMIEDRNNGQQQPAPQGNDGWGDLKVH